MLKFKQLILIIIISLLILLNIPFSYAIETGKAKEDVKLRKEKLDTSTILEIIPKGDEFEILEKNGDWYQVNYKRIKGYVLSELIEELNQESNEKNNKENNQTKENTIEETTNEENKKQDSSQKEILIGEKAYLKTNVGFYLRPVINSKIVKQVEAKKEVRVIEILNHWTYVEYEGNCGWVCLDKLTANGEEKKEAKQEEPKKEETTNLNKTAYVTSDGINFREEANIDSKILKTFLQNAKITILQEEGDWYKIKHNNQEGYILKTYVSEKKTEVTSRSSETRKIETTSILDNQKDMQDSSKSSSKGQEVVEFAKQYLGSRYVYGGATPKGFDCSGFTMYVYKKFGINLAHSATAQSKVGTKVEKEKLELGDLVFFSDYRTYKGIGHCGIYIGDGKFIHASTEKTGVITSSLNSGSYVKRYVKATRVI